MRICVDCGEEYRPEIAVCADCGGRLEDRTDDGERTMVPKATPLDESAEEPDEAFTYAVLLAERAADLRSEADRLIEAGIDFRLRPSRGAGYRLLVAAADRDRALDLLGLLADPGAGADARSCPACGVAVQPEVADCPECGLAVGDEPEPAACPRCGHAMEGPNCPECGP